MGVACSKPLAIDLYCGLGGWTEGLLAEGYDVIGFDIERRSFQSASVEGVKARPDGLGGYGGSFRRGSSKSHGRKMASAMIAKIPIALSRHIARTFHPAAGGAKKAPAFAEALENV